MGVGVRDEDGYLIPPHDKQLLAVVILSTKNGFVAVGGSWKEPGHRDKLVIVYNQKTIAHKTAEVRWVVKR